MLGGPPRGPLWLATELFMYVYAETVEKLDCTCAVWGKPGLGQGRGGKWGEQKGLTVPGMPGVQGRLGPGFRVHVGTDEYNEGARVSG